MIETKQSTTHTGAPPTPPWRRYLSFWGPRVVEDVDDELRFAWEMRVQEFIARGMSEDDARRAAAAGGFDRARAHCLSIGQQRTRRMLWAQTVDALRQDFTFAVRGLARRKMWTLVAVMTLALGIGATTAVFSVVDHVLLHPLGYPAEERIASAMLEMRPPRTMTVGPRAPIVAAWRKQSRTLEALEAVEGHEVTHVNSGGSAVVLQAAAITPGFASFAGTRPLIGRDLTESDALVGTEPVVLLAEHTWRTLFGADRDVLGRRIVLDGVAHTIVGVMPSRLRAPAMVQSRTDVWLPMTSTANGLITALARLRPTVSVAAVQTELDDILAQTAEEGEGGSRRSIFQSKLVPVTELVKFRDSLFMFSVAVVLVLFIACVNVAHLLLGRAAARNREVAVRRALGAGRARVVRLLLTESALLAGLGGILGVAIAWVSLRVLLTLRPPALAQLAATRLDTRALAVTAAVSIVAGVVFGIVAALHALRREPQNVLKGAALSVATGRGVRARGVLVMTEIAVSAMLLVGATLLIRTVINLQRIDPGFDPHGVYTMRIQVPFDRYKSDINRAAFYDELALRARSIPGVQSSTIASNAPPRSNIVFGALTAEGRAPDSKGGAIAVNYVRPNYFSVLRARFISGGSFRDASTSSTEVIVNRSAAATLWPGATAVGKRLRYSPREPWLTVVGVVDDDATTGAGIGRREPMLFILERAPMPATLIVRAPDIDPRPLLRQLLVSMESKMPSPQVTSLAAELARQTAQQRFTTAVLSIFAAIAVALSAIGVYGVMNYTVSERTREIGIRVALGASSAQIAGAVARGALLWIALGIGLGLAGALWEVRLVKAMLFGVAETDLASFVLGGLGLLVVALIAASIPTRRATAVDPLIAMRVD
jgi:putative ABC transport system permease protein